MTSISETTHDEYNHRTYEDLSREFQTLLPQAMRAFQLIPLMYNRLTIVDKLSHNQAIKKIHDDHNHIHGFSPRSIRRYLPADNPAVPRRIRPSWHKKSITWDSKEKKLSYTEQIEGKTQKESQPTISPESSSLNKSGASLTENDDSHTERINEQKQELIERVTKLEQLNDKYKESIKDLNNVISNSSFVTAEQIICETDANEENIVFEFSLRTEVIRLYLDSIDNGKEPIGRLWLNGTLNKNADKVLEIHLGRVKGELQSRE